MRYWLWKALLLPRWARWRFLWRPSTKHLVGTSGFVFDAAGYVLVVWHTRRKRYPWGLPGIWVAGRERLAEALTRELT